MLTALTTVLGEIMDKRHATLVERFKRRIRCRLGDCGPHFTFEIAEHTLKQANENKRIYVGHCAKCAKAIKLKASDLSKFGKALGEPKVIVLKSTFDALFDTADAPDNKAVGKKADRKSTRLNSSHSQQSRMPSSA